MRVIGIDPGSRITGFGIIDYLDRPRLVEAGCIRAADAHDELPQRLRCIYDGVAELVRVHQPHVLAIEQVFLHKNADSALKLGQARGAAICGGIATGLPVFEYSARQVKLAVTGKGSADKRQVQHMVRYLMTINEALALDASDALAVALCHVHHEQTRQRLARLGGQW